MPGTISPISSRDSTMALTMELIARPSVTPEDMGCQSLINQRLADADFDVMPMNCNEVSNLWATHGSGSPVLVLLGHTDVVPPGPLEQWESSPFTPTIIKNRLYGRGAADMKGGVAAMVTACERFAATEHQGTLAVMLTSDEEGPAVDGTAFVVNELSKRNQRFDYCIVGEPTCDEIFGDTIKIGRRGSLNAELTVFGKQGHVAYPEHAINPIHETTRFILQLIHMASDDGDADFPSTQCQITSISSDSGATNMSPAQLHMKFNFRYHPNASAEKLRRQLEIILQHHQIEYALKWNSGAEPYRSRSGSLRSAAIAAIQQHTGIAPALDTGGGTSDGRFLAAHGAEVIEFGLTRSSIHKVNEWANLGDLPRLSQIYEQIMRDLLGG